MRILLPASAALLLAACATTPRPAPVAPAGPVVAEPVERGDLIGASANDLSRRFGPPRLTVREGVGTKLQFANEKCVIDAYLYPPASGSGAPRVTHVDTRTREGRGAEQNSCITSVELR